MGSGRPVGRGGHRLGGGASGVAAAQAARRGRIVDGRPRRRRSSSSRPRMGARFCGARGSWWGSEAKAGRVAATRSAKATVWAMGVPAATSVSMRAMPELGLGHARGEGVGERQVEGVAAAGGVGHEQGRALAGAEAARDRSQRRWQVLAVGALGHADREHRPRAGVQQAVVDHERAVVRQAPDLALEPAARRAQPEPQLAVIVGGAHPWPPGQALGDDRAEAPGVAEHATLDDEVLQRRPVRAAADHPRGPRGDQPRQGSATVAVIDPDHRVGALHAVDEAHLARTAPRRGGSAPSRAAAPRRRGRPAAPPP